MFFGLLQLGSKTQEKAGEKSCMQINLKSDLVYKFHHAINGWKGEKIRIKVVLYTQLFFWNVIIEIVNNK